MIWSREQFCHVSAFVENPRDPLHSTHLSSPLPTVLPPSRESCSCPLFIPTTGQSLLLNGLFFFGLSFLFF